METEGQGLCEAIEDEPSIRDESQARPAVDPTSAPMTILVIDPDSVTRRYVEIAFARADDVRLLAATESLAALEILANEHVDLVLSETSLPDLDGMQLFHRVQGESRLRDACFVFLSADDRPGVRRAAFAAGADDYLMKPCEGELLVARIRGLVQRQRLRLRARQAQEPTLSGRLSELCLLDLVGILEQGARSGTIFVADALSQGLISLEEGRVTHAAAKGLSGSAAFMSLVAVKHGRFAFVPGQPSSRTEPPTITEPTQDLLARGWRALSSRHVTATYYAVQPGPSGTTALAGTEIPRVSPAGPPDDSPASSRLLPAFVPDAGAAAQLERGIEDQFTLGEILGFSEEELAAWTKAPHAGERFHVVLAAELSQGVSSLLSMAGAPTERWVLRTLEARLRAVGLAFYLRRERLLDIVLVDIDHPARHLAALERVPSLLIVAPPQGDVRRVSLRGRVELGEMVARLTPPALLIAGEPSLKKVLRTSAGAARAEVGMRANPCPLGEPGGDLRTLLVQGIRLCAGLGAEAPPSSAPDRSTAP